MITNLQIGYNGRLGNQLFQYAACYAIAKNLNVDFVIPLNNETNIKEDGCWDHTNNKWIPYNFRMYEGFNITAPQQNCPPLKTFSEPHFHYTSEFDSIQDNTSIQGYYQSEKYFLSCKEDILKEFTFKSEILDQALNFITPLKEKEVVAIHIRRGDNIVNPNFPLISMDYIQEAMNQFTDKEYTFLVISDDIEYCKQVFPEGVHYSEGHSDYIDMCLMSLSDHNIISNSSFSWWGAYLNSNPEKKVIAPNSWFKNPEVNTQDLIPENWVRL